MTLQNHTMKKFLIFTILSIILGTANAQNYLDISVNDIIDHRTNYFCVEYDGICIHAKQGCTNPWFCYDGQIYYQSSFTVTHEMSKALAYNDDCGTNYLGEFFVAFGGSIPPSEPWIENQKQKCPNALYELWAQETPQDDYTYLWNTGDTTAYIMADVGNYSVTVTSICGDVVSDQIVIVNGPDITPDLGDDKYLCHGGNKSLYPGTFASYLWSTGETTPSITVSDTGWYYVVVHDIYGCSERDSIKMEYLTPPDVDTSIPILSTDTITMSGNNMLVWKVTDMKIREIGVYREASSDEWIHIANIPYENGIFIDEISSNDRSWRYRLRSTDTCGNVSEFGRTYQSMNAAYMGPGISSYWVEWTPYKIANQLNCVDRYDIYSMKGYNDKTMTFIGSSTNEFFLDVPPSDDSLYIVVANISSHFGGGTAISNFCINATTGVEELGEIFDIYPNPNHGEFTLSGSGEYQIINCIGQVIAHGYVQEMKKIRLHNKGLFFVKTKDKTQKLIIY